MTAFKNILCPVDFSEPSVEALRLAIGMAGHFSAQLCLLHVMEPLQPVLGVVSTEEFEASRSADAVQRLHGLLREVGEPEVPLRLLARSGAPAQVILDVIGEEKPDLVVMATQGRTGWQRLVLGSVAEQVTRLSPCPVLTTHGQKE